jgi:hypothetical protein
VRKVNGDIHDRGVIEGFLLSSLNRSPEWWDAPPGIADIIFRKLYPSSFTRGYVPTHEEFEAALRRLLFNSRQLTRGETPEEEAKLWVAGVRSAPR